MGQISVSVKIDPTRGRRAMNARKYKIRKEVEKRGGAHSTSRKEGGHMGENVSMTPDFTIKVHQGITGIRP